MVTTRQNLLDPPKTMRKESKHNNTESPSNHKETKGERKKGTQWNYKTARKQITKWQ